MATDYTTHYNLDKYTDTDKPNLRDQYNAAMDKIDNALLSANTNATEAKATTQGFQNSLDALDAALPIASFDTTNTVAAALATKADDSAVTTALAGKADASDLQSLSNLLPSSSFDSTNTVAAAISGVSGDVSDLSGLLPATSFDSTNTVAAAISAKMNSAEGARFQKNLRNRKIVVVGDSLSTTGAWSDTAWPTYLAQLTGCTTYNKAIAGTGFVNQVNGQDFYTQLQNAVADQSFNNSDITDVIIIGGYNDYAYEGQIGNAVTNVCNYAHSSFPNAQIHVGAMLKGCYPIDYAIGGASSSQRRSVLLAQILFNAHYVGASIIRSPWTWFLGMDAVNYDNIHVNSTGQRRIAGFIYDHLCGGSVQYVRSVNLPPSNGSMFSEFEVTAYTGGELVNLNVHMKFAQNVNVGTTLFSLPGWGYFSGDRGIIINPLYGDSGSNQAALWLNGTEAKWMKNGSISETGLNFYGTVTYPLGL